jgi:hypothetical protein
MNKWRELNLGEEIDFISDKQLHDLIVTRLKSLGPVWIVEYDVFTLTYRSFDNLTEMATEIWGAWPSVELNTFIMNYSVDPKIPMVRSENGRESYFMKNRNLALKFLEQAKEMIKNNVIRDNDFVDLEEMEMVDMEVWDENHYLSVSEVVW